MQPSSLTKAVFPVAGLGTRFLPATKANPKEMLPIVDKPLIQYAVEEAIAAGIEELIFVTSSKKRAIEDHFDTNLELEMLLGRQDKQALLHMVKNIIPSHVSCVYIRQNEALGLGHAVLCAKKVVGNDPFAVLLADDFIDGYQKTCLEQMKTIFQERHASVIAVEPVAKEEVKKYGIIDPACQGTVTSIKRIIEKPEWEEAPSNLAVVGRYILTPKIFELLESTLPGKNGEIQLTDAIQCLLKHEQIYAYQYQGKRYDCGTKLGYVQAIISQGLKHPEIGAALQAFLN